jgi:hypothetical protein
MHTQTTRKDERVVVLYILDSRGGEKDKPEIVECSKMGSKEGMCDQSAHDIVGEDAAKGESIFPAWWCSNWGDWCEFEICVGGLIA